MLGILGILRILGVIGELREQFSVFRFHFSVFRSFSIYLSIR